MSATRTLALTLWMDALMTPSSTTCAPSGAMNLRHEGNRYRIGASEIGPDTVVHPFTFIGRDSSIGAECVIGPFATLPRQSIVPEGTTVAGNVTAENATLPQGGG